MDRRRFLQTATTLAAVPALEAQQSPAGQQTRRNIIFVLGDDHRFDMIGALGHPMLRGHTPNLDRMVNQGVTFRNAFVTTSLCSPSRASILTGLYMHQHGVTDNFSPVDPKLVTFPQLLQKAGYRTGFFGKWHMGGVSDEQRPGFDHWLSFRGQGEYTNPEMNLNGVRQRMQGNTTDILTASAVSFMRDNAARPFFAYLSHKGVHAPFQAPERHAHLFEGMEVSHPRTMPYKEEFYRQWPEWVRRRRVTRHGVDGIIDSDEPLDVHYRRYCQCLIALDESLGEIFRHLEATNQLENTMLVYMGDNGFLWGEHGLVDKRAMYEASIRVPLLAHCPGLFGKAPRTVNEMALNLDIGPTFLDAAGLPTPSVMHGRSLLPLAAGKAAPNWRKDFIYEYAWEQDFPYTPNIVGLRTETHSLMNYPGIWDMSELYDLRKDPDQVDNLLAGAVLGPRMRGRYANHVKDPAVRETVDQLQARLAELLAATGGDPRLAGRPGPDDKFAY